MYRSTSLFGISMVPRANRRGLVVVTYVLLLGMVLTVGLLRPTITRGSLWWMLLYVLLFSGLSQAVFGRLISQSTVPEREAGKPSLPSIASNPAPSAAGALDERDVAVRNAAYYSAFRIMAWYIILLFLVLYGIVGWTNSFLLAAGVPLLTMALTLPQAIILWRDPDIPAAE